jgi:hypothetical protein
VKEVAPDPAAGAPERVVGFEKSGAASTDPGRWSSSALQRAFAPGTEEARWRGREERSQRVLLETRASRCRGPGPPRLAGPSVVAPRSPLPLGSAVARWRAGGAARPRAQHSDGQA